MAKTRSEKRIRPVFSSRQWTDVTSRGHRGGRGGVDPYNIYTIGLGSAKRPRFGEGRGRRFFGKFWQIVQNDVQKVLMWRKECDQTKG